VPEDKPEQNRDSVRWKKICAGDASAFDGFYRENAQRLQVFLRLLTGNEQAAEDVMQETFTQMWKSPNGFQPERGSLRAYLFGIGRKRAAEWRRRNISSGESAITAEPATTGNREMLTAISDAFAKLNVEQRSLLWLREVEGQSYAELAEVLDIPVGTVRSRLFTAREDLRRIWHGTPAEERNKP
jgi:RNA polymerase sigma-70 factor (ECF subfamily)